MLHSFLTNRLLSHLPFLPNEDQGDALSALSAFLLSPLPRRAFVLSGYAGTGKTSLVSALVKTLNDLYQPFVLLAPTGRAAKVLARYSSFPAYTIHKYIYRQERIGAESFALSENKHLQTLFIVDEASMISAERDNPTFGTGCLLDDLIAYVYSGQRCSLLLLGDDAQLPPVGQTDSPALNIDYLKGYGLDVQSACLTTVARQALDSGILMNATRVRDCIADCRPGMCVSEVPILEAPDVQRLSGSELLEAIENSYRTVGVEDTIILTRSNRRTNLYNQGVRSRILWREEELGNGDRLMVSKNNYFWTEQYDGLPFLANGDMLELTRLRNERELYGFRFADVSVRALDYDWEIDAVLWLDTLSTDSPDANYAMLQTLSARIAEDYPEVKNKKELWKLIMASPYYNALQVRFAYAVTCHKAQGGQWRHVYIDPGTIADEDKNRDYLRWFYTALTRSTEQVYLLNLPNK